jgi:hypothetical protein
VRCLSTISSVVSYEVNVLLSVAKRMDYTKEGTSTRRSDVAVDRPSSAGDLATDFLWANPQIGSKKINFKRPSPCSADEIHEPTKPSSIKPVQQKNRDIENVASNGIASGRQTGVIPSIDAASNSMSPEAILEDCNDPEVGAESSCTGQSEFKFVLYCPVILNFLI